jgi:hypothetical protein
VFRIRRIEVNDKTPTGQRRVASTECAPSTGRWIGVEAVVNTVELEQASTYELALWCKLLRDRGWTGPRIARTLGRSEGYVNNLIRILDRASLAVLARWRREQQPGSHLPHACATDWLMQVCLLPHERQDEALQERLQRLEAR